MAWRLLCGDQPDPPDEDLRPLSTESVQWKQEFKKFGNMTIILQKYVFKYKKNIP